MTDQLVHVTNTKPNVAPLNGDLQPYITDPSSMDDVEVHGDSLSETSAPVAVNSDEINNDLQPDTSGSSSVNGDTSNQAPTMPTRSRRWIKQFRYRKLARRGRVTSTSTNTIVNLSSYELTVVENAILSKGLKYVPTPRHINSIELRADLTLFARRLRLRERFYDSEGGADSTISSSIIHDSIDPQHPMLRKKIFYTPPSGRDLALYAYITAVETEILNTGPRKVYSNIISEEISAINSLSWNPDIVIKEADKGSAIVVMNTNDYLAECHQQLGDTTYYKPLTKDPTTKFARKVTAAVREARSVGVIDDDMESALTSNQPRPGCIILPKVHKYFQSFPPGRPIISGSGIATEKNYCMWISISSLVLRLCLLM